MEISNQKIIINRIENIFKDNELSNKIINFFFKIDNGKAFLTVIVDNGKKEQNYDLGIEVSNLQKLYLLLYLEFKDAYLDSYSKMINIYQAVSLLHLEIPFLVLTVHGSHNNIVKIHLINNGHENDVLEEIKADFIKTVASKKSSRK